MNQYLILCILGAVLFISVNEAAVGRQQAASARGKLMYVFESSQFNVIFRCKGKPAGGLNVKMYDHDTFTPDDKIAAVISQIDGAFDISGHRSEVGTMRPDVKIYHKCGHIFEKCHKVRVPESYVTVGSSAKSAYDMGTISLENAKSNC
jgi:hypothetical protein